MTDHAPSVVAPASYKPALVNALSALKGIASDRTVTTIEDARAVAAAAAERAEAALRAESVAVPAEHPRDAYQRGFVDGRKSAADSGTESVAVAPPDAVLEVRDRWFALVRNASRNGETLTIGSDDFDEVHIAVHSLVRAALHAPPALDAAHHAEGWPDSCPTRGAAFRAATPASGEPAAPQEEQP